jgi:hypothetical protein
MRTRGRLVPTRGRGGGHDWVGVDALLWVDHVEIRLLLCRIKAVLGAMRHVRVVVAIVMVHEVQRDELESPVRRIYKKKKVKRAEKKKKRGKKRQKEKEEGKRTQARVERARRFDSRTLPKEEECVLFIFILFYLVSHSASETIQSMT